MALASSEGPLAQRFRAVWKPKMNAKGLSRAKENLHLDMYFTGRSGSEAFRERYSKR